MSAIILTLMNALLVGHGRYPVVVAMDSIPEMVTPISNRPWIGSDEAGNPELLVLRFYPPLQGGDTPLVTLPEADDPVYLSERLIGGLLMQQSFTQRCFQVITGFSMLMLTGQPLTGPVPRDFDDQPDRRAFARNLRWRVVPFPENLIGDYAHAQIGSIAARVISFLPLALSGDAAAGTPSIVQYD